MDRDGVATVRRQTFGPENILNWGSCEHAMIGIGVDIKKATAQPPSVHPADHRMRTADQGLDHDMDIDVVEGQSL